MQSKSWLSIVIPAYNEEKRIELTLSHYCNYFREQNVNAELIVVIDGFDGTLDIVKEYKRRYDGIIKYLRFSKRLGKGGALLKGFAAASGEIVGFVDADGSVRPHEIMKLVKLVASGQCDGAIGSRWIKGARLMRKPPIFRIILSRGLNALVKGLLRINFNDTQCGAKVFKRKVIEQCIPYLDVNGYSFDIYLLYAAIKKGYRIKEVPLEWQYLDGSKIVFSDVLEIFWDVCRLRVRRVEASSICGLT